MAGSGGFRPSLTRTEGLVKPSSSVLASEHAMFKRSGITLDADLFTADTDGRKIAVAGLVVGEVATSGLYGPYDDTATDGRETAAGVLIHDFNLTDGDVVANLLIHGSVLEARCTGVDAAAKTDLAGQIVFQ